MQTKSNTVQTKILEDDDDIFQQYQLSPSAKNTACVTRYVDWVEPVPVVCACVQSDIIHQSAQELIHSEDRDAFKSQLDWRSQLTADNVDLTVDQLLQPGMLPGSSGTFITVMSTCIASDKLNHLNRVNV